MTREPHKADDRSLALHSGEYVERYQAKPIKRVARLVPRMKIDSTTRIVDYACGNGMLLQAIGDKFASYDGVDFSPDFVLSANAWAERTGRRNYKFHLMDIRNFCAENQGAFDVAATLDFSEHIDDALAIDIYSAIRTSLRPEGKLFLHTPNLEFFLERARQFGMIPAFPEHIAVRNGRQTATLLTRAGFSPDAVRVETIAHYNILKHLHPFSKLPLVGPLFSARLWIEATA